MIKKFPEEKNFNMLKFLMKGLFLILLFFFLVYFIDKFFDIYDLKFQNPIIIRSPILIQKRVKSAGSKGGQQQKKTIDRLPAVAPSKTLNKINITQYKKYLTSEGYSLRLRVLKYVKLEGDELVAFDNIIKKESGYDPTVINEIGAGGLCQAYPYTKMDCKLDWEDWQCQVDWCLRYIKNRYQNPINAWFFHQRNDWF